MTVLQVSAHPSSLTSLHVDHKLLTMLLGLLSIFFQLSPITWGEQCALFAVSQKVGQS